jgi:NhaA family Na+:H+ antiporter
VRVFLLSLAIVDDIGAIVVIAIFYSRDVEIAWLLVALSGLCVVWVGQRYRLVFPPAYLALGIAVWLATRAAGIHPTIVGVALGLLVPASPVLTKEIIESRHDDLLDVSTAPAAHTTSRLARHAVSQLEWLLHRIHPWSTWVVVPVFAFANAGVTFSADSLRVAATSRVTIGVVVGLVVGKMLGIWGASWLACKLGLADRPSDATSRHLTGAAALAGIGFTVSLFITGLAFDDPVLATDATAGVFVAAIAAATISSVIFWRARTADSTEPDQDVGLGRSV